MTVTVWLDGADSVQLRRVDRPAGKDHFTSEGDPFAGQPPAGTGPAGWYPPPHHPLPGYPQPGHPPPARGTNGFAIAALVLGIIGGFVLSAIFGFVALRQIRRSGQGGRGLAIAGLALSGLWALLFVVGVAVAIATSANRDDSGAITAGGSVSATALRVGDCISRLEDATSISSLPAVPCAVAHKGEVFAVFDLPSGPYPGAAAVDTQVQATCNARLDAYAPSTIGNAGVGLYFVYPLERNWLAGDREVVCIATSTSGSATGSIRGR